MDRKHIVVAAISAVAVFGAGVTVGQNAPTQHKGLSVSPPTFIDLTNEFDGFAGHQLRLRTVTIDPGGVVGIHDHKGHPTIAYALQGTVIEHLDDGSVHEHEQGTAWTEANGVRHWSENKSGKPVMIIAVDVFKP